MSSRVTVPLVVARDIERDPEPVDATDNARVVERGVDDELVEIATRDAVVAVPRETTLPVLRDVAVVPRSVIPDERDVFVVRARTPVFAPVSLRNVVPDVFSPDFCRPEMLNAGVARRPATRATSPMSSA